MWTAERAPLLRPFADAARPGDSPAEPLAAAIIAAWQGGQPCTGPRPPFSLAKRRFARIEKTAKTRHPRLRAVLKADTRTSRGSPGHDIPLNRHTMSMRISFAVVLCVFMQAALAEGDLDCSQSLTSLGSLASLPSEVRESLASGGHYQGDIAEPGGPFNPTDAGGAGPRRRLLYAAAWPENIVVLIEHGGRGRFTEQWLFRRTASGWIPSSVETLGAEPANLEELARTVCRLSDRGATPGH